jgi:PqqD family protein of HPr-rel-A system
MPPEIYWRSSRYESLHIEEWDDGFAVFQPDSGRTHFLNPLGMQILADLHYAGAPAVGETALSANLAARLQLQVTPEFLRQVHETLCRFDELGLIVKVARDNSGGC